MSLRKGQPDPPLPIVILVAGLFSAGAVYSGVPIIKGLVDAWRLRDAVETTAHIDGIEQTVVKSGDGTRLKTVVSWRSEFHGQAHRYKTERLVLFANADSKLIEMLHAASVSGEPVACYVAPGHPSLCVFSLEFSIPLLLISILFPIAFGTVGALGIKYLIRALKKYRQEPF